MKRIIIVRHGDTKSTEAGRYHGIFDVPLSAKGEKQIKKLSQWLDRYNITHAYTSPLSRCRQTAEIILKKRNIRLNVLPELREINFGAWEGLTLREIMGKYPEDYKKWIDCFGGFKMPNGEKVRDMIKRVKKAYKKILSNHKKGDILIVTHGGPVRIILMDVLRRGLDYFWKFHVNAGSVSVIEFTSNEPAVRCFNAVP